MPQGPHAGRPFVRASVLSANSQGHVLYTCPWIPHRPAQGRLQLSFGRAPLPPYPSCSPSVPRMLLDGARCASSAPAPCPGAGLGGARPAVSCRWKQARALDVPRATHISEGNTRMIMVDLEQKLAPLWAAVTFSLKRLALPQKRVVTLHP